MVQSCQGLGGEMSEILHKDNIKWVLRVLKVKDIQE